MPINVFCTLFWVLYFPLCIGFYQFIGFDYIDEILSLIMVAFALMKIGARHNRRLTKEVVAYVCIMAFYLLYSLFIQVTVKEGVLSDLLQQARPYVVFYSMWFLAPQFTRVQKNVILTVMMLTTTAYAVAFLAGMQSVLGYELGESAIIGQLSLVTGMAYYLFRPYSRKTIIIAIAIVCVGIMGGKSKFFGELVAFVALVYFLKGRIKFGSTKAIVQFCALAAVILFFTWTKFNAYYVEGMMSEAQRQSRPESYKVAVQIMGDYFPFGSGLGSFATAAAAKYYSPLYYKYKMDDIWGLSPDNPMFLADAFYPTLAEYGVVGLFLFLVFWKRRLGDIRRLADVRYYKIGLMCMLALGLESTADTSYLSGKGMGYFMLLGMCVSSWKLVKVRRLNAKR